MIIGVYFNYKDELGSYLAARGRLALHKWPQTVVFLTHIFIETLVFSFFLGYVMAPNQCT